MKSCFIAAIVAAFVAISSQAPVSATHVAVAVRAPVINHVNLGHVVQTYSYGYAPPVQLFAAPAPVFAAPSYAAPACPVVQAAPPPVPTDCAATYGLFAAPSYGSYGFAAPSYAYRSFATFAAPAYSSFRLGFGNHGFASHGTFAVQNRFFAPRSFASVNVNVGARNGFAVNTFRAPIVPQGVARFNAAPGASFFQQTRQGPLFSRTTTIIR